ncbi:unnamed protein product [Effrenium voratum]|uniref:Uncharacterized protein n=1 Tax=Effrenium voratum TaxID=2562239 RepID=A0AA36IG19_9DINO|nr:unnamed protein product [Effrenium voratum]CAJ1439771.1 unnamed protein product [Effrenium voratum]
MLESARDEEGQAALLKRVGLSVLHSNTSYWERSREEASEAEQQLEQLRREAKLRAARCEGQLETLARDAREEQERRLISDRIGRELEALRSELRQKEAAEEERLRHLYRSVLGPESVSHPAPTAPWHREPDLSLGIKEPDWGRLKMSPVPPLILSEAKLLDDPLDSSYGREDLKGDIRLKAGAQEQPERIRVPRLTPGRKDMRDADKLLRVNLARLERLERFGL